MVPGYCPNGEPNMFYSYHRHQQHIMYASFQVLSIINDYCFIHRIPVSLSGASTYNKLSRIMMLCCCTHSSLIHCNHSYKIPEYEALYDLKRQWYYEFVPFSSNQPGIDILILGGDVAIIVCLFYVSGLHVSVWENPYMMTSSNGNVFRVTGHLCGELIDIRWIPAQRLVMRNFDVFFDMCLNKRLNKQSWGWWFETPSRPLWRHCNVYVCKFHTCNSSLLMIEFVNKIIMHFSAYLAGTL